MISMSHSTMNCFKTTFLTLTSMAKLKRWQLTKLWGKAEKGFLLITPCSRKSSCVQTAFILIFLEWLPCMVTWNVTIL